MPPCHRTGLSPTDVMLDRLDETIVAISSAPGCGAVGIVRLSGPEAITLVKRMAQTSAGEPFRARPGSTRVSGEVFFDADLALPAFFYVFRAPHSYTRQNMVEVYTIGAPAALELVRRRAVELGARPAQPGEFTARSFVNGAMDLAKAEAVAGVIRAQSDTQLRASRRMMDGAFFKQIVETRDTLAELVGLVEADIDFAEEPIEFITPGAVRDRLGEITVRLQQMLAEAPPAERLEVLPRILLLGPSNAGKSLLMNRLSGTSRAICAAAAGTTRDILSAPVKVGRGEAILLDAAGVDRPADELLAAARAMALSTAEQVELVCLVVNVTGPEHDDVLTEVRSLDIAKVVIAANKCDLISNEDTADVVKRLGECGLGPVCPISALMGTGIDALRQAFAAALAESVNTTLGEAVFLSERQRNAIVETLDLLQRAVALSETAVETIDCADRLAFELREALEALGVITGEVTTEDLLDQVFANFCIGK